MDLLFLVFILWLPILAGLAIVIGVLSVLAGLLKRYQQSRGATGWALWWPMITVAFLAIAIVWGMGPAVLWYVSSQANKPGTLNAAESHVIRMYKDCKTPQIAQIADFIMTQPFEFQTKLEGLVLRMTSHCVVPVPGEAAPDASWRLFDTDRQHLQRMAASHKVPPPMSSLPVTTENYKESWLQDAEHVEGMLVWQEHGLTMFDQILADPALPMAQREAYVGLAAAHCLQQSGDTRCRQLFTVKQMATIDSSHSLPSYWNEKLRARLDAVLAFTDWAHIENQGVS